MLDKDLDFLFLTLDYLRDWKDGANKTYKFGNHTNKDKNLNRPDPTTPCKVDTETQMRSTVNAKRERKGKRVRMTVAYLDNIDIRVNSLTRHFGEKRETNE